MRITRSTFAIMLAWVITPVLRADVVVSWGPAPDIVSVSTANMTVGYNTKALGLSAYSNPTVGANYYPNATGKSPRFYAATVRVDSSGATGGLTGWRVTEGGSGANDTLFANANTAGIAASVNHIYLWTKNEFLATGAAFQLNGMSANTYDNGSGVVTTPRFVIQLNGANYYVSQSYGEGPKSFTDPTTVTWYAYAPTTDFTDLTGAVASLTTTDFQHLTAVGVYVRSYSNGGSTQSRLTSFEVAATVVSESRGTVVVLR